MTRELFWLTLTVILTGVMWIPYIIDRIMVRGLMGAMANPSRTDKPHSPWASRMLFAHENAAENLAIFAPLVLVLNALDYSTTASARWRLPWALRHRPCSPSRSSRRCDVSFPHHARTRSGHPLQSA